MKLPNLKDIKLPDTKKSSVKSEKSTKQTRAKKDNKKKQSRAPLPIRFLRTVGSVILTTFLSFMLFFVVTGIICSIAAASYVTNYMDSTQEVSIQELTMSYATNIFATNPEGEQEIIYNVRNDVQRIPVEIEQVPQHVRNAFVFAEDKNFYSHQGVDYKRTVASFANMLLEFWDSDQGGSTITQQLVKNLTQDNEKSPQRKIREIFRAMQLEKNYSKDEILMTYMNYIGFGGPINGIQLAAKKYFGKDVSELSVAEAACLAAIPQNPEKNNPFAGHYLREENKVTHTYYYTDEYVNTGREENRARMEYILEQMYENGALTYDEYQAALSEHLIFTDMDEYRAAHPEDYMLDEDGKYVEIHDDNENYDKNVDWWVVNRALTELANRLMEERGVSFDRAMTIINTNGYQIYTTYDMEMQDYVEEKFSSLDNLLAGCTSSRATATVNRKGEPMNLQCGFTAIDYHGNILCTVGGVATEPAPLGISYASTEKQQVGSAIKPVTSYGYALDNGLITYSTKLLDKPPLVIGGKPWPTNYSDTEKLSYTGQMITVEYALQKSYNTIPALLCKTYGLDNIFNFATETLGLDLAVPKDKDYSPLAVGGLHFGITIEDLVNAFMVYGSGGYFSDAHIISRVESSDGKVVYSFGDDYNQVIKPQTATIMNHLLQNIVQNGTGSKAKLYANGKQIPIGGKTGTSSDWFDKTFVGLNPDFVSGLWIGYPENKKILNYGAMDTGAIWKNIIGQWITTHYSGAEYPPCDDVIAARYCTNTGKIAGSGCPKSATMGYYDKDTAVYCNGCRSVQGLGSAADT